MTIMEITNLLTYDGRMEVSQDIDILFFVANGAEVASDIFYTLTEKDINDWATELGLEAEGKSIHGIAIQLGLNKKTEEVEDVDICIEAIDENGELSEEEPHTVDMDILDSDFIKMLMEKVDD